MSAGRIAVVALLALAVLAGAGLFYLEQFHWYDVREEGRGTVTLTTADGSREALDVTRLRVAEGDSSPLKYRACFEIDAAPRALADRFAPYPDPEPTVAPVTFPCFEADALASALAAGDTLAFMGQENITYGIDRVVAVGAGGEGFAWHQINRCGARVFDGDPPPEGCPPPPADTE
jgi:hypothetical protein